MLGIVVSRADEASVHIGERVRELADWSAHEDDSRPPAAGGGTVYRTAGAELRSFDDLHIALVHPEAAFDAPSLLVFVSRHAGDTGPLLTAHHTGNFGPAEYGGKPNELAHAAPGALTAALDGLDTVAPDGYDAGLECTHHGPTALDVPSLFVEIGSDVAQWRDPAAATAAARAVLTLRQVDPYPERTFVGFGGGHYAPRFTRIVRETDWAVGHIVADWGLSAMGEPEPALVRQVFDQSGAHLAVVDGDYAELTTLIEALGYRVVGESWLRETTGVPLTTVDQLETTLRDVETGLRFGNAARDSEVPTTFEVVEPPAQLLADANGVAIDRVRSAIEAEALAYETVESGTRAAGRVAVPDAAAWKRIESSLVEVLRDRFDEVTVEADAIVAIERSFDPERARELGVEPGPAFGRLAADEPVTVDGVTVDPETVHVTRKHRYPR